MIQSTASSGSAPSVSETSPSGRYRPECAASSGCSESRPERAPTPEPRGRYRRYVERGMETVPRAHCPPPPPARAPRSGNQRGPPREGGHGVTSTLVPNLIPMLIKSRTAPQLVATNGDVCRIARGETPLPPPPPPLPPPPPTPPKGIPKGFQSALFSESHSNGCSLRY